MMIFGISSLISGAANTLLPETLGQPLPETLRQAKSIGHSRASRSEVNMNESEPLLSGH